MTTTPQHDTKGAEKPRFEDRLCLGCKYFSLDVGQPGWSEYTPGSEFDMSCSKSHWRYEGVRDTEEGYRACLLAASVCPDYQFNESLIHIEPRFKTRSTKP